MRRFARSKLWTPSALSLKETQGGVGMPLFRDLTSQIDGLCSEYLRSMQLRPVNN